MTEVSDTTYDAYLEGLAAAKEEQLHAEMSKAEKALEEIRGEIQTILDDTHRYYQDGQWRISGYPAEERYEDLLSQEGFLEAKITELNNALGEL